MINVIGTPDIKVLTGVRRSGKSKMLEAFKAYVQKNIPNAYIESNYAEGKENFVFIDEVQMCDNFELCINNLHAAEMYDIYITGSNAFLLSSDAAMRFMSASYIKKRLTLLP